MFRSRVAPAFEADVLQNTRLLKDAVRQVLEKEKPGITVDDFSLRFDKVGDDRYQAQTNLPQMLNLSIEQIHQFLKVALLGVSGVDQRLGEMNAHTALSGFTAEELPLFRSKLDSIADAVGSHGNEQRFRRVVAIAGLPRISADTRIDIEKVLKIRSEPEAIEFRSWLADIDKLSDSEIRHRIASFNSRLGLLAQGSVGKLVRFLVTTVVGLVQPPLGIGLGLLDQFAWDKFARKSGIATFVHESYPSIFSAPHDQ